MCSRVFVGILLAAALVTSVPASAEMVALKAALNGAEEVPPTDSKGMGSATLNVDTEKRQLTWIMTFSGLSGDATAAHLHGPADKGANAPPAVDISKNIEKGMAELSESQLADLLSGKVYVNIHTSKFPDGEIRGQVTK